MSCCAAADRFFFFVLTFAPHVLQVSIGNLRRSFEQNLHEMAREPSRPRSKVGYIVKGSLAFLDFGPGERFESLDPESLDRETRK